MASQDDRKSIRTLRAIPSTTKVLPSSHDRDSKWPNPPVPIPEPRIGQQQSNHHSQYGRLTVKNPYLNVGLPATNRTAKQTILSKKQHIPRKTVRRGDAKLYTSLGTTSRDKGKGKVVVPSVASLRSPSPEVIDVDADHASTDDLNLSPGSPLTKSPYFDSKAQSDLRKVGESKTAVGPSLVGDGDNTKQLQARHQQTRNTSPISSYTEDDEVVEQWAPNPSSKVQDRVAQYEELAEASTKVFTSMNRITPIIDLRTRKIKSRMQPKSGSTKTQLKLASQASEDVLNEPSGLRNGSAPARQQVWSLPIAKLVLGIQHLPEYDFMEFENGAGVIKFTSPRSQKPLIGPISVAETFDQAQCTDSNALSRITKPIILFLRSSGSGLSAPWQLNYDSVFQIGSRDNKGQITLLFNTEHERWDASAYRACINRVVKLVSSHSLLRPKDAERLWSIVSKTKYTSAYQSPKDTTGGDEGRTPRENNISESDVKPDVHDESQESDIALIESPLRQSVEDLCRRMAPSEPAQNLRKRSPNPLHHNKNSIEDAGTEPPFKRQRTEDAKPLRRSTRQSIQQEKAAKVDPDEVVLVYPFGVPGAVNITAGDLNRLQPEEFLNDTLIEFGLKSWLKELEVTDPPLAAQVHVFNSFFYKKLNKRSIKEGYDSVRKWTSKIDVFSKKYIIIPINENLHWYLAVIYEPEHVLRSPPPSPTQQSTPVTRRQTRESWTSEQAVEASVEAPAEPIYQAQADSDDHEMLDGTASENEVEQLAFSTSCSITITSGGSTVTNSATNLKKELVKESGAIEPEEAPGSPMEVDPDITSNDAEFSAETTATVSAVDSSATTPIEVPESFPPDLLNGPEVTPARFSGKPYLRKRTGKVSDGQPIMFDEGTLKRTKIFILDSLGNRHPQAMKQLSKWLEMEASDKKKIESITLPVTKMAPVPVQPNYCDCGLYILHFAATFMSDPKHYCHIIMTKERPSMPERRVDWKDASVSLMRDNLRQKILRFSDEWHQMRAAREEQKQENAEGEDEDSDVAIVEHVKPNKKGKPNKPTRTKS